MGHGRIVGICRHIGQFNGVASNRVLHRYWFDSDRGSCCPQPYNCVLDRSELRLWPTHGSLV